MNVNSNQPEVQIKLQEDNQRFGYQEVVVGGGLEPPKVPPAETYTGEYTIKDGHKVVLIDDMWMKVIDNGGKYPVLAAVGAKWPCPVPWVYGSVDSRMHTYIQKALTHITKYTGWSFVARGSQTNYLKFISSTGCASYVGRQGGAQNVWLNYPGCTTPIIMHEIGHALGLVHEQSRSDRDTYVNIYLSNVQSGKGHNFNKDNSAVLVGSYDFGSIMQYGQWDFSSNGAKTLSAKGSSANGICYIGQRTELTKDDIKVFDARHSGGKCTTVNALPCASSTRKMCGEPRGYGSLFGEYTTDGSLNGKTKYKSNFPDNSNKYYYLYYRSSIWWITRSDYLNTGSGYIHASSTTSDPKNIAAGQWKIVVSGSWTPSPTIKVSAKSCPSPGCTNYMFSSSSEYRPQPQPQSQFGFERNIASHLGQVAKFKTIGNRRVISLDRHSVVTLGGKLPRAFPMGDDQVKLDLEDWKNEFVEWA